MQKAAATVELSNEFSARVNLTVETTEATETEATERVEKTRVHTTIM